MTIIINLSYRIISFNKRAYKSSSAFIGIWNSGSALLEETTRLLYFYLKSYLSSSYSNFLIYFNREREAEDFCFGVLFYELITKTPTLWANLITLTMLPCCVDRWSRVSFWGPHLLEKSKPSQKSYVYNKDLGRKYSNLLDTMYWSLFEIILMIDILNWTK